MNIDWDLIAKYLSKETSTEENDAVEKWINLSEENKQEFFDIKNSWETFDLIDINNEIDVTRALHQVKTKITAESKIIKLDRFIRVAAAIFIAALIGFSAYYYNSSKNDWIEIASGTNQNMIKSLPDGSVIYLNANTIVKYPKKFDANERKIKLTGEAFFEVEPDKNRPFIITTYDSRIKVLGTSFNVNSYSSSKNTTVTVSTGKVEFTKTNILGIETGKVLLEKGHKGIMDKSNNEIKNDIVKDENHLAWRTKIINFNQTPLAEVKQVLESVYQVPISFEDENLKDLKLTASFDKEDIQSVIKIIEITFSISSKYKDGKIILAYKESSSL